MCISAAVSICRRPKGWCTQPGAIYQQIDCDNDLELDHVCHEPHQGYTLHGLISFKTHCNSTFPRLDPDTCTGENVPKPVPDPVPVPPTPGTGLSPAQFDTLVRWGVTEMVNLNIDFCYRQSYGRGVGTPMGCPADQEENGALCYPKCPEWAPNGAGPVCWSTCPEGFSDTGIDCLKPSPYGRGAGRSCLHGFFECDCNSDEQRNGLMCYPRCRDNFHEFGCCVCSPDCPEGMTDVGISCQKNSHPRGAGSVLSTCGDKEEDAALCYSKCDTGFHGVGPVCWSTCSAGQPVDCGVGCAKDSFNCAVDTSDMVLEPIEVAMDVCDGYGLFEDTETGVVLPEVMNRLLEVYHELQPAIEALSHAAGSDEVKAAVLASGLVHALYTSRTVAVRVALGERLTSKYGKIISDGVTEAVSGAMVMAVLAEAIKQIDLAYLDAVDPTGLVGVYEAYRHPKCEGPTPVPQI